MENSLDAEDGYSRMIDFRTEAKQSLEEVRYAIGAGWLSQQLPDSNECVFLNLTTVEGGHFCIRLSWRGFEVSKPLWCT